MMGSGIVSKMQADDIAGREQFFQATTEAANSESDKYVTITMDGATLSQATVEEAINESSVQISGNYTKEQAEIIVSAINGGVLDYNFEILGNQKQTSTVLGDKAGLKIALGLLAILVGVAPSTFNAWVKAKKYPRIDKIERLANYFGILKSDLIEEKSKVTSMKTISITEDEQKLLDLFRLVPENQQQMVLQMIEVALKTNK